MQGLVLPEEIIETRLKIVLFQESTLLLFLSSYVQRNQTSYQYNETRYSRSVSIPVGTVKFIFDVSGMNSRM